MNQTLPPMEEGLPPIWILNLPRSQDRRQKMAAHMAELGLPHEFVTGVDGLNLTETELSCYSRPRALRAMNRELARNEIGCALAHIRLYERIVREEIEEVLILEDDVNLTVQLLHLLRRRRLFGIHWDVINFSNIEDSENALTDVPLPEPYRLFRIKSGAIRTVCYLVSLHGAKKALAKIFPIRAPADNALYQREICGLAAYCVLPSPVVLTGDPTTIWIPGQGENLKRITPNFWSKTREFFSRPFSV